MHTTLVARPAAAPSLAAAGRHNPYLQIHKGLRSFMMDTLMRVGRLDVEDAGEMEATLAQLDGLLTFCAAHLKHENDFIHAALEARQPGAAARIAAEHDEHLEAIGSLRVDAHGLRTCVGSAEQMPMALRLYRHLALFVGENFQHMHVEETAMAAALWAVYSDEELGKMHGRLVASIPPQTQLLAARWMIPAMSPAERAGLVGDWKTAMPPEALLGVLQSVRPHLDDSAWNQLARAAAVPQQPGLVAFT